MTVLSQSVPSLTGANKWLLLAALVGFLLLLYLVAVDQGFLLSLIQGRIAFDQQLIHELTHDARHAAGFPCH